MYAGIAGLGISGLQPNTPHWVALASLSALLAAGFLFLARIARLGFLANFLSRTVLVGFLTGVGIQVAIGQVGGMLGIPPPNVAPDALSGAVRKLGLTLWHIGDASWQTTLVSAIVLAILIGFGRYVKQVPGGLVAVIGLIAASWIFDFQSHDISTLGPVPSGLPHVGFPKGVSWSDTTALLETSASLFLVILAQSAATSRAYAVKYREPFDESVDLVGLGLANLGAGFGSTFVVNGSPTKTEMADEGGSHTQVAQLTTAAVVALVLLFLTKPLQYLPNAVLASVVFLIGVKLIDIRGMREILRLRKDEFAVAAATAVVVVVVGVEQGIILAIVLSLLLHVRAPLRAGRRRAHLGRGPAPHPSAPTGAWREERTRARRLPLRRRHLLRERTTPVRRDARTRERRQRHLAGSSWSRRASTTSTSRAGRRWARSPTR